MSYFHKHMPCFVELFDVVVVPWAFIQVLQAIHQNENRPEKPRVLKKPPRDVDVLVRNAQQNNPHAIESHYYVNNQLLMQNRHHLHGIVEKHNIFGRMDHS